MTEMTEERLAEYRTMRELIRTSYRSPLEDDLAEAVDEIDRLRAALAVAKAENERLRERVWHYGDHELRCPRWRDRDQPCGCGFDEFIPEPAP